MLFGEKNDVTTTANPLAANQPCVKVIIQAKNTNTDTVYVGNATIQPLELTAGAAVTLEAGNLNQIRVKSASGTQKVSWGVA